MQVFRDLCSLSLVRKKCVCVCALRSISLSSGKAHDMKSFFSLWTLQKSWNNSSVKLYIDSQNDGVIAQTGFGGFHQHVLILHCRHQKKKICIFLSLIVLLVFILGPWTLSNRRKTKLWTCILYNFGVEHTSLNIPIFKFESLFILNRLLPRKVLFCRFRSVSLKQSCVLVY